MREVLVFQTSITNQWRVIQVKPILDNLMHSGEKWNFDLEDCDHILRVEAIRIQAPVIIQSLNRAGFICRELED
ncbi:hypothetical protein HUW51_07190 [Adhaeribacter swui]|uniref:Uncharacterized protein n=1 Tax=Adhaeribacter swui TaxID=2086471 RepID=A0A7G7G5T6_9BACT|nr:hypothetical protein [Adhaeribacter swui]QNF32520.1 hypothetical protein HUW51_07190 [Adhaeribacter swui]